MNGDRFFFKQKTAYEMRISDWSSDVCSSDLRIGLGRRQCLARHAALRHRLLHRLDDRPAGAPVEYEEFAALARLDQRRDHLSVAVGQVDEAGEIGRASCRERVWTYG